MPIDVVNANQVESSKWVVNVFKSNVANVLFVSFHAESNERGYYVTDYVTRTEDKAILTLNNTLLKNCLEEHFPWYFLMKHLT